MSSLREQKANGGISGACSPELSATENPPSQGTPLFPTCEYG